MSVVIRDSVIHLSMSGPHECDSHQKKEITKKKEKKKKEEEKRKGKEKKKKAASPLGANLTITNTHHLPKCEKTWQGPIQACPHHWMVPVQISHHIPLSALLQPILDGRQHKRRNNLRGSDRQARRSVLQSQNFFRIQRLKASFLGTN